jgi:uncharacterized protein (TIGR03118 family)
MSTILTNVRIREARPVAVATFVALALQACGGGGGGNNPPAMPPTVTLAVSPTTITVGQSATLTWSSANATSCSASGTGWTGNQQTMGSATETPTAAGTVTYTLTCSGAVTGGGGYGGGGGTPQTATQTATLTVNPAAPPPQTAYVMKALVADTAGPAAVTDPNLVNPWGLVFAPNDPVWTSNNGKSNSTLYDGNGAIAGGPLVVALPAAGDGTAFEPTGIVAFTPSTQFPNDFTVTAGGQSGPAFFIYAGLGGQIAGWNPTANPKAAISAVPAQAGTCYRGLAIANNGTANFLYANDFIGAKIDVFDAKWTKQSPSAFPFTDPNLPANYAPFNIQAIANGPSGATQIYVSYAMSGTGDAKGTCEDTRGAGFGLVNVYDANGKLVTELVKVGGQLNAPWGMALAPADFGTLSGALLVANHADGTINGYDPVKGTWIGTLQTSAGPFAQDGLWGIAFGNDGSFMGNNLNQPHNTLFFTAGPNKGVNGLYGRIDLPPM